MALEVGIVGLPGAGKTTLFTALTKAGGGEYGKTNVGMAPIADERLDALAERRARAEGHAGDDPRRRTSPAPARAARQPAPGRRAARRARRLRPEADPAATSRTSSSSCSSPTATTSSGGSSASRSRRSRATRSCAPRSTSCGSVLAHVDAGGALADYPGELPRGARAADDEAADRGRERPGRHRPRSSRRSSPSCSDEEAAEFRDGGASALEEVVAPPARRARPDHVLHRGREGDARVDAPERRDGARRRRDDPLRHRARLHPLRGDRLAATSSSSARTPRSRSAAGSGSRARPTSSATATC